MLHSKRAKRVTLRCEFRPGCPGAAPERRAGHRAASTRFARELLESRGVALLLTPRFEGLDHHEVAEPQQLLRQLGEGLPRRLGHDERTPWCTCVHLEPRKPRPLHEERSLVGSEREPRTLGLGALTRFEGASCDHALEGERGLGKRIAFEPQARPGAQLCREAEREKRGSLASQDVHGQEGRTRRSARRITGGEPPARERREGPKHNSLRGPIFYRQRAGEVIARPRDLECPAQAQKAPAKGLHLEAEGRAAPTLELAHGERALGADRKRAPVGCQGFDPGRNPGQRKRTLRVVKVETERCGIKA